MAGRDDVLHLQEAGHGQHIVHILRAQAELGRVNKLQYLPQACQGHRQPSQTCLQARHQQETLGGRIQGIVKSKVTGRPFPVSCTGREASNWGSLSPENSLQMGYNQRAEGVNAHPTQKTEVWLLALHGGQRVGKPSLHRGFDRGQRM